MKSVLSRGEMIVTVMSEFKGILSHKHMKIVPSGGMGRKNCVSCRNRLPFAAE